MTDDVATPAAPAQSIWRTIVIAVRSAISAIALIAVFDRQFVLSKWLHWALANWKDFFNFIFGFLPFHVPEENRPFAAFSVIVLSTVVFDIALRWRSTPGSIIPPRVARNAEKHPRQKSMWVMAIVMGVTVLVAFMGPAFVPRAIVNAFKPEVLAAVVLLYGLYASPRMFVWLAAFTVAFLGVNEIALLIEGNVPAPPAG